MKRGLLGIFALFRVLLLAGCGKDTPEVVLCKSISPQIEKYEQKQISYDQFLNQIEADYNNYCKEEKGNICTSISLMYSGRNVSLELEDCSIYNENTDFGKARKDLCESSNDSKKLMASKQEETQNNSIFLLKRDCDNAK